MTTYRKTARPRNADPNTAFTQVSEPCDTGTRHRHQKVRVALNHNDLLDDSYGSRSKTTVRGAVLFGHLFDGAPFSPEINGSCRSFNNRGNMVILRTDLEEGAFFESGVIPSSE